ncbi:hypothetical protein PCCS19_08260 [Paenibacillus sp. CCS19]|uniref:MarR family winged helix-turn-helix transcriptional regulator n=1 Tax=Paenibacillus sp. CCS19 TaxID=3158387 RepID=UPI00255FDBC6|nr:MarR family transcriptional regulator [Paenibacillus cellulosilyticus]GMK37772.1 hypothetical protein PCCS19_08260 [Paenibacillus cellulosilyticus]
MMVSKETLFEQLVSLIASSHQLHYEMTKDLPKDDITPLQYEILEFLLVKQPITLSELSECKGISLPNTSREVKKLTDKGLCEKLDDAGDRRKQYIRLSAGGEARMNEWMAHMKQLFLQKVEGAQDAELAQISEAIGVLKATLLRD